MLLGSDGPGGIQFNDPNLARQAGLIGLSLILYEGGLQTSWRRLRQVAIPAGLLSTVGVVVSALLTGVAAHWLFDLSWLNAILLGSVVSSTDAAAVFSTLRFTHIRTRLARTLEAESGGNDPIAIALTLGLIAWIQKPDSYGFGDLVLLIVRQVGLGLIVGAVLGFAASWTFARLPRSIGAFAPVASLAIAAVSFGSADVIGGSGFLAVYLVGLAVGGTPSQYRRQTVAFHEGLAFLAQVGLFVALGLLVFPRELVNVAAAGMALTVLLALVIRPAAIWSSTIFNDFTARERMLLGWAGLRGAVPIVLATFVLSAHLAQANTIFNAVFFVVVTSTILQGTTLEYVAGKLGLLSQGPSVQPAPIELSATSRLALLDFAVAPGDSIAGVPVREIGLPRSALIAAVSRGDDSIPPRGSTIIEPGDLLYIITPQSRRVEVEDTFIRWRERI
jgi:cell volume regulation protein A